MGSPHRYIPNTEADVEAMLEAVGARQIDDLFADIPPEFRLDRPLAMPAALTEAELMSELGRLASKCADADEYASYLGAGIYDHYIPSVVDHLISRSEFYTAYTPYQAEVSQGTLQAIFEYQTTISELTGMEVSNASMYDAGTGVAEAAIMACASTRRSKVLVSRAVNPRYRQVLQTYAAPRGIDVMEIDFCKRRGTTSASQVTADLAADAACLIVQSPNYFGIVEEMEQLGAAIHAGGGLFVAVVNPISLGVLAPPGSYGADIAVGEGQPMGIPMSFGGPLLGFFATTSKLMRKMPGRLVGQTVDSSGRRGFVLTLQAREQHIRRESATSNICSNEALCALASTIYMSLMGPTGLRKVAETCLYRSHYLRDRMESIAGFTIPLSGPFFNEFVVRSSVCADDMNEELLAAGIIGGKSVECEYPELSGCTIWAVTERRTREQLDTLIRELEVLA